MSNEKVLFRQESWPEPQRGKRWWAVALAIIALILTVISAKFDAPADALVKPSITLDQCSNKTTTCDSANPSNWQNGNLGTSNSDYAEGESVAYRSVISNLTVGQTYAVDLEWDSTENGGHHAIDYLTSFDRTESTADPCAGVTCAGSAAHLPIPIDSRVTTAGVTQLGSQRISAYGATFLASGATVTNTGNLCGTATCTITSNPSAYGFTGTYAGGSQTNTTVYFTATSTTAVLSWGGHIASRQDWGSGNSASALSGSPYHMRVIDFACSNVENCSSGNMDRSLSAAAVILPASITIVKQASVEGSASFSFTGSPSPLSNFSLIDDGTSANTQVFSGITSFTTYVISESSKTLWSLDRVSCSVQHPNGGTRDVVGATATVVLAEGEDVTCVWYNTSLANPVISVAKTANPTTYKKAGDVITYTYVITNTGNTTLGPDQFKIDDDRINGGAPFNCGSSTTTLNIGETVSCTADYSITAADITNQSVVNTAFATGAGLTSGTVTATVTFLADPSISIAKTANPSTYSNVGDVITYSYVITNTGNTTLGPTQFQVDDNRINGGTPFNCGAATTTLNVGETVTCTADYVISEGDVSEQTVVNTAFATGAGLTSGTVTATVTYSPPETTTTTTTTTIPASTTTLPGATTTVPATTTLAPTTTAPAATTIPTTTIPTELQAINPEGGAGVDGTFDVLFPEELPATGWRFGLTGILGLLILFIGVGLLSLTGVRRNKTGEK